MGHKPSLSVMAGRRDAASYPFRNALGVGGFVPKV
jgi:hypothetical protein